MQERAQTATVDEIYDHVRQLERLVSQMAELQVRQIDRERNVPGSDPAELDVINADLAAAQGIARKLAEILQP
jgi:hypothetical protein